MSLRQLQSQFPHEVLPTHYELRLGYPSVAEPHTIGEYDNLLDAHRDRIRATPGVNPEAVTDETADKLRSWGESYEKPYIVAVYPDGSYAHANLLSHYADLYHQQGWTHLNYPPADHYAARAKGSDHERLIHALYTTATDPVLNKSPEAVGVMNDALRNHDVTAALVATDLAEEAGANPKYLEGHRSRLQKASGGATQYARSYSRTLVTSGRP